MKEKGKGIGAFYTPPELTTILLENLITDTTSITSKTFFDPTAGCGNLLLQTSDMYSIPLSNFYCMELEESSCEELKKNNFSNIVHCNSLYEEWPSNMNYIIGNPPFVGTQKQRMYTKESSKRYGIDYDLIKLDKKNIIEKYTDKYLLFNYSVCWIIKCIEYINKYNNCRVGLILPLDIIRKIQSNIIEEIFNNNDIQIETLIQFLFNWYNAQTKFIMLIFSKQKNKCKSIVYKDINTIETKYIDKIEFKRYYSKISQLDININDKKLLLTNICTTEKIYVFNSEINKELKSLNKFQYTNCNLKNTKYEFYADTSNFNDTEVKKYKLVKKGKYLVKNININKKYIIFSEYLNSIIRNIPIQFFKGSITTGQNNIFYEYDTIRMELFSDFFKDWCWEDNINEYNCVCFQRKRFDTFPFPKKEISIDKEKVYNTVYKYLNSGKTYQDIFILDIPKDIQDIYDEINEKTIEAYKEEGYIVGRNKIEFLFELYDRRVFEMKYLEHECCF